MNSNVGPSVVPTVIPSHSSQDDDTYEVNTEVKRVNSHESMGEHYVMMRDVQDNDLEPTILPTHLSQADNKYDVKTEVGKGSNYVIMGEEHSKMTNERQLLPAWLAVRFSSRRAGRGPLTQEITVEKQQAVHFSSMAVP